MKHLYTLLSFVVLTFVGTYSYAQCTVTFTSTINGLDVELAIVGTGTASFPGYGVDWGDGNIGVGQNPSHTYAAAGTYTVCAYYFDLADTASCNATYCEDITVTSSSASIKEIDEPLSISVYPNPVTVSAIKLQFSKVPKGNYTFELRDVLGRTVMQKRIAIESDNQTQDLKLDRRNTNGVYMVKVFDGTGQSVFTQKLVVQ